MNNDVETAAEEDYVFEDGGFEEETFDNRESLEKDER